MFHCPHKIHKSKETTNSIVYRIDTKGKQLTGSHGAVFVAKPHRSTTGYACAVKLMLAPHELDGFILQPDGTVDISKLESIADRYTCITPFRVVTVDFPLKELHAIIDSYVKKDAHSDASDTPDSTISMLSANDYDVDIELSKMEPWSTDEPWCLKSAISQLMLLKSTPSASVQQYWEIYKSMVTNQSLIEGVHDQDFPLPCKGANHVTGFITVPCIVMPLYCSDLYKFVFKCNTSFTQAQITDSLCSIFNELYGDQSSPDNNSIVFIPDLKPSNIAVSGPLRITDGHAWYRDGCQFTLKIIDVESIRFSNYHYCAHFSGELAYAPTIYGYSVGTFTVTTFPSLYNLLLQSIVAWIATLDFVMKLVPSFKNTKKPMLHNQRKRTAALQHESRFSLYDAADRHYTKLLKAVHDNRPYSSISDIDAALYHLNEQRYPAILQHVVIGPRTTSVSLSCIRAILPSYEHVWTRSDYKNNNECHHHVSVSKHMKTPAVPRIPAIAESSMIVFDARLALGQDIQKFLDYSYKDRGDTLVLPARQDDIDAVMQYCCALKKISCAV